MLTSVRAEPIDQQLFIENRRRLQDRLLPNSLAAVNANDVPATNADGTRFVELARASATGTDHLHTGKEFAADMIGIGRSLRTAGCNE